MHSMSNEQTSLIINCTYFIVMTKEKPNKMQEIWSMANQKSSQEKEPMF